MQSAYIHYTLSSLLIGENRVADELCFLCIFSAGENENTSLTQRLRVLIIAFV